jgi:hypothetical protein
MAISVHVARTNRGLNMNEKYQCELKFVLEIVDWHNQESKLESNDLRRAYPKNHRNTAYKSDKIKVRPETLYRLMRQDKDVSSVVFEFDVSLLDRGVSFLIFEVEVDMDGTVIHCGLQRPERTPKKCLFSGWRVDSSRKEIRRIRNDLQKTDLELKRVNDELQVVGDERRKLLDLNRMSGVQLKDKDRQLEEQRKQIQSINDQLKSANDTLTAFEQIKIRYASLEVESRNVKKVKDSLIQEKENLLIKCETLQNAMQSKDRQQRELQEKYTAFEYKVADEREATRNKYSELQRLLSDQKTEYLNSLQNQNRMMHERQLFYPLYIRVFLFVIRWLDKEFKDLQSKARSMHGLLATQVQAVYLSETGLPGLLGLASEKTSELMAACFSKKVDETFMSITKIEFLEKVLVPKSVLFLDSRCSLVDRMVRLKAYSSSRELSAGCSTEERQFHIRSYELITWYLKFFLDIHITYPNLMHDSYDSALFKENVKRSYLAKEMVNRDSREVLGNLAPGTVFDFETCGYAFGETWRNSSLAEFKVLPLVSKILS